LDIIGGDSSSEGRKTPTLTPRKGILKSPKVNIRSCRILNVEFRFSIRRTLFKKTTNIQFNFQKN